MTGVERNEADRGFPATRRATLRRNLLRVITAAVFVAILASRLPGVNQPFGRDQGIFACMGQNILKGSVPYRDMWDQKPPGIHFTYALLMWLFGDSMRVMQVADLLAFVLTAFLVYSVVRDISGMRAGVFAMLIYFFYSDPLFYGYSNGYWARSQTETYMVPFLVAGLWAFVRFLRSRCGWLAWLAGLFWGAAFLYKYTAVLYPVCAMVFLAAYTPSAKRPMRRQGPGGFGRTMIAVGCGFGISLVPFIVYFGIHGALKDLFEATILYNLRYIGAAGWGKGALGLAVDQIAKWVSRNPFLWLTGMAGAIAITARIGRDRRPAILLFWLAAAWAAIALNGRYFHYYFIQAVPPLAMLSAGILDFGIGSIRRKYYWMLVIPALVGCGLLLARDVEKVRQNVEPDLEYMLGRTTQPEYYARFVTGDFSFLADKYLAEYISERTDPEDPIFVFGFEPLVYFLAERRPASRFIYNDPVTLARGEAGGSVAIGEMMADLESSKPAYIVIVEGDANPVDRTDSYTFFMDTPSLRDLVETRYTLDRQARKFHIYKRKAVPGMAYWRLVPRTNRQ